MIVLLSASAAVIIVAGFTLLIEVERHLSRSLAKPLNLLWISAGLTTGLLCGIFSWIVFEEPIASAGVCVACTALVLSVVTDIRHGVLADINSLIIAIGALMSATTLTPSLTYPGMIAGSGTALSILGLAWVYMRLRGKASALGGGDLWLAAACGLWGSATVAAMALGLGSGITLLIGLLRGARANTRLPFAPGIGLGYLLAWGLERAG